MLKCSSPLHKTLVPAYCQRSLCTSRLVLLASQSATHSLTVLDRPKQTLNMSMSHTTSSSLPSGNFAVGVRDLEYYVPADHGAVTGGNHLVGRLFYPGAAAPGLPTTWIPSYQYASGYVNFMLFLTKDWKWRLAQYILKPIVYLLGITQRLPVTYNARLDRTAAPYPFVIFSHGLAGNRNTYSSTCIELASHGYVVLAVEHADGSASMVKKAPAAGGYMTYQGLGGESGWTKKLRYRVEEVATAKRLMTELTQGVCPLELTITGVSSPGDFMKGLLDPSRATVIGHSFGGATAAGVLAEHEGFNCGVALDPWWDALPGDSPALTGWRTSSPLLIIGSHDWNTPDAAGKMKCNGVRQRALMEASRVTQDTRSGRVTGGGSLLVVPKNSTHHSFDDVSLYFDARLRGLMRLFRRSPPVLSPDKAISMTSEAIRKFLGIHMPLSPSTRGETNDDVGKAAMKLQLKDRNASASLHLVDMDQARVHPHKVGHEGGKLFRNEDPEPNVEDWPRVEDTGGPHIAGGEPMILTKGNPGPLPPSEQPGVLLGGHLDTSRPTNLFMVSEGEVEAFREYYGEDAHLVEGVW